jgi:hypothetical protein
MTIEDPLKPLDQVYAPDVRRPSITGTLAAEHEDLASIQLNQGVPEIAAQLFETAKNVSLYSWFVYRFHPIAESTAFAALELALNLRKAGSSSLPSNFRSPGLSKLLREAIDNQAISENGFPSRSALAESSARLEIVAQLIAQGRDAAELPEPSEQEVTAAAAQISLTKALMESWPKVRNSLAHGSPRLTPLSRHTLRLISEAINQLYP